MKIANIIEEARVGGPQLRILNIAKELKKHDITTTVIIPEKYSQRYSNMLESNGIGYKKFRLQKLSKKPFEICLFLMFFVFDVLKIYKYLKKEQFNLVHISGGSWQWKGLVAAKLAGVKTVWHLNDTSMPIYILMIFKLLHRLPDGYIFAAQSVKKYYNKTVDFSSFKHLIIQAPVDVEKRFNPQAVQQMNLGAAKTKIGIVANINPVKGIDTFVDVVRICNRKEVKAEYFIAGMVSNKSYFGKIISLVDKYKINNITFLGPCDDVPSFLKSLDLYLCTSANEASPISVWEAMSMEKPIISNSVGDVSLIFENNKNGIIVNYDIENFAENIIVLLGKKEKRESIAVNARKKALKEFSLGKITMLHKKIYEMIYEIR